MAFGLIRPDAAKGIRLLRPMKNTCPLCQNVIETAPGDSSHCANCGQALGEAPAEEEDPTTVTFGGVPPNELLSRGIKTDHRSDSTGWKPPEPAEVAAMLPKYGITELIGAGGMGAVYKGRQESLDRTVAIKLLPAEITDNHFIARFEREAKTLAKLQHPGIVAVYDSGRTSQGHLYFVMEFVDGVPLNQLIHNIGITPGQSMELVCQVCDALQYAHDHNVIHRDIKPANILVDKEGRAKLVDFGLARRTESGRDSHLTTTNNVMGTLDYMAPEQQNGHGEKRSDIYSLGVTLYEMLCKRLPKGVWTPPSQRMGTDPRLDEVIHQAMQEEPVRRFQEAGELKSRIGKILATPNAYTSRVVLDSSKESVKADAKTARIAPRPVKTWKPWMAVAAGLVLLIGGGWWIWQSLIGTPPVPEKITPATATKEKPFINTLGMKFVPVPIVGGPGGGKRILFSVWHTRVQDYEAFMKDSGHRMTTGGHSYDPYDASGANGPTLKNWKNPGFKQNGLYPVTFVSHEDAVAFCVWLSNKEGRYYRLPSDHEWSCAVGIGDLENPLDLPKNKKGKIANHYPWGTKWPPPSYTAGNYAGAECNGKSGLPNGLEVIPGYIDNHVFTAPVGSYQPNKFGLCELGSNLREWCACSYDESEKYKVLRGASWLNHNPDVLLSSARFDLFPYLRNQDVGFRCVMEGDAR